MINITKKFTDETEMFIPYLVKNNDTGDISMAFIANDHVYYFHDKNISVTHSDRDYFKKEYTIVSEVSSISVE